MKRADRIEKARRYLATLCAVRPDRRTGSPGNREATDFLAGSLRAHGFEIDATPFACLEHVCGGVWLTGEAQEHEVSASPYTPGCDVVAELVVVSTVDELERCDCEGKILLLKGEICAELLSGYRGEHCIEIAALNGEDHYSAGGQMDYLRRYGAELLGVLLAVNVDDVGYREGRSAYSFYGCAPALEERVEEVWRPFDGLVRGEPWFSGDHMIFVQSQVPSVALTAELAAELLRTVTHTAADRPELVDGGKLVEVAEALRELVESF